MARRAGSLHHVEIYVSDLARSITFWGWLLNTLGYTPHQIWPEGRSWKLGCSYLLFVKARRFDVSFHRTRTGLNHLAFHARSRRHVDTLTKHLQARGVRILYEDRHPHAGGADSYAVYFEDPDRIKVEIVAP